MALRKTVSTSSQKDVKRRFFGAQFSRFRSGQSKDKMSKNKITEEEDEDDYTSYEGLSEINRDTITRKQLVEWIKARINQIDM